MTIFLDLAPDGGGVGVFAAVASFLILAAVAFIAFKLLKKTLKMAFRMAIAGVILVIAIAGSISFWWLGSSKPSRPEPRPRPARTK